MRKLLYLLSLSVTLSLVFTSCVKTTPEYSTDGTDIHLTVDEASTSATSVVVKVKLDDDQNYYYCEAIESSKYTVQADNHRFMQVIMDSVYRDYINWRYEYLVDGDEYIADFSSHCLCYGDDNRKFTGLAPQTEYLIVAFCVNPENNQPVGELYYTKVTTTDTGTSSMTFEFHYAMHDGEPHISVVPSNDKEYYFCETETLTLIEEEYGGSVEAYAKELIGLYEEAARELGFDVMSRFCKKGFCDFILSGDLYEEGEVGIVFAVGYDGGITTEVQYDYFVYPYYFR